MINSSSRPYQICSKTVMDTIGDNDIQFDEDGVCNYFHEFTAKLKIIARIQVLNVFFLVHALQF